MRSAWIAAESAAEIRGAARDWKHAGVIEAATLAVIEREFPYPRLELARAWRVLVFVLVSAAVLGVQFAVFGFDESGAGGGGRYLVYGAFLGMATEILRGSRLSATGSDAATSFWAVMNLIVAYGVFLDAGTSREAMTATLVVTVLAWAIACWRWGFSLYAAFATVAGFLALARAPADRLWWGVVGAGLSVAAAWLSNRPRLSGPRRRAFAGVFIVSSLALYGSVNLYSVDNGLVERIGSWWEGSHGTRGSAGAGIVFVVATGLLPVVFIAWGIVARRRLVLDTGALLAALSVLTLYHYVPFGAPAIIVFGLALVGIALWLNRLLTRAADGELRGFTASPLLSVESESTGPASALVAAAVAPISAPHSDRDFTGGGGRAGGGGATGTF